MKVAVPINFGMLSYPVDGHTYRRLRVAVPINFGMLSYSVDAEVPVKRGGSQSPSILECSPTDILWGVGYWHIVAVPINFGMLSYVGTEIPKVPVSVAVPINFGMLSYAALLLWAVKGKRRSPHQFWNALLPFLTAGRNQIVVAVPINFGMLSYTC